MFASMDLGAVCSNMIGSAAQNNHASMSPALRSRLAYVHWLRCLQHAPSMQCTCLKTTT